MDTLFLGMGRTHIESSLYMIVFSEQQSPNTPKNNAHVYMSVCRCISTYCIHAPLCTPHQKGYTVHMLCLNWQYNSQAHI